MSNKTTFKRVALAVVAALGFGVLSIAPSSAAVTGLTVSTTATGTVTTAKSDSSTVAGTLAISWTQVGTLDSVLVTSFIRPIATTASPLVANSFKLRLRDTATSTGVVVVKADTFANSALNTGAVAEIVESDSSLIIARGAGNGTVATNFSVFIDTAVVGPSLLAGTYTVAFVVTPYNDGVAGSSSVTDLAIVVAKTAAETAAESKVVDPTKSIAIMDASVANYDATTLAADSTVAAIATAGSTNAAVILVRTFNAAGAAAAESVTATISGAGTLCSLGNGALTASGTCGASLTLIGGSGVETLTVRPNGTAGTAKIDIKTTTKTFATKSLTFFATAPATYDVKLLRPVVGTTAATKTVEVTAKDSNGNVWASSDLTLFSSDTTIATAGSCSFDTDDQVHYCSVTGVKAGETKWTLGNKSTLATSTVKSAEFAGPRVSLATPATVKIEFNKAAYAPGEKAMIYVTPLDSDGKALPGGSTAGLLATGGITTSVAFSSGSDTLTATTLDVATTTSATTGAKAGSAMYTVYMPFGKGTVTLTAKGGTGLPVAGQVALTASASVVDDSVDAAVDAAQEATDAAIAATDAAILAQEAADEAASAAIAAQETAQAAVDAVTALSAEVTKLVAQLATLQKLLNRVAKRVGVKL